LIEKWIAGALVTNGGDFAVAGINESVVGKLKDLLCERFHNLFEGTAPEIGAANAASEERVASEELGLAESNLASGLGKEKADAAGSVAGRVKDVGVVAAPFERIAVFQELIDPAEFGGLHAEKGGLDFHGIVERKIVIVHHDRRAGVLVELGEAADVVDVGVSADDGFDEEFVAAEQAEDALDLVTRVDDDGFVSFGITDDGTVALQQANRNFDVNHIRVGGVRSSKRVGH
jgi:hypothetical protein